MARYPNHGEPYEHDAALEWEADRYGLHNPPPPPACTRCGRPGYGADDDGVCIGCQAKAEQESESD